MTPIKYLDATFAVAGQLTADDFAALAAEGFKSILANRPDGEDYFQLTAAKAQALATAAGLEFRHLPLRMPDIFEPTTIAATQEAIASLPQPVLAYCRSGTRSAIAWAAAESRTQPVDALIGALGRAGYDVPGLADELQARKLGDPANDHG